MSSHRFVVPADTRAAQNQAIDPHASVWVSANAGSGKTYVLTRRVIRLLLDGVDPARILCLTFTKAAAANMQNRIFAELAAWVALDDAALAEKIADMTSAPPEAWRLALARRLFALAVETPGGLRIQTIHAFCERLLHVFPLEANVPATFTVLDDADAAALLTRAVDRTMRAALRQPEGPLGQALARVAEETTLGTLHGLIAQAVHDFADLADDAERYAAGLARALGLAPGDSVAAIDRATLEDGIARDERTEIAAQVRTTDKKTDLDLATRLIASTASADVAGEATAYRAIFLTGKHEARKSIVTQAVAKAHPALAERLQQETARVVTLLEARRAAAALERSVALFRLARAVATHMQTEKSRRAWLDFDDLIARTATLLERTDAAWVLYKLDGGIDHLLVDEAQDTSPLQWTILKALTAEFFAGEGASNQHRSVFAVGDEKQSIYSFQGADPREFDAARRHFRAAVTNGGEAFSDLELKLSFRSTADVLNAVDRVFGDAERSRGLSSLGLLPPPHSSARDKAPGLVELWPPFAPVEPEEGFSNEGIDVPLETAPLVLLARRIARRIAGWLARGDVFEADGAPIRAGDVMILVRRRNAFFEAVIRALKREGVTVAGADRLKLADHIAVMDLMALGRAMLLPEDDLTVAALLKSPFCGLDDSDLIALAPGRKASLWAALAASDAPRHRSVSAKLAGWLALAREADPFTFYATVLGRDRGRHDLLARLGLDAAEAIDVFLADAQAYGLKAPPSLRGFLDRIEAEDRTVKRDMDAAGDAVRVMTVHAAKGLEARVVFLADTFSQPMAQHDSPLLPVAGPDGAALPVWALSAKEDAAPVQAERQRQREANWDEYRRLLYVAMTRAGDRLYVAGYHGRREVTAPVWYRLIETALHEAGGTGLLRQVAAEDGEGDVLQWRRAAPEPVPAGTVAPAATSSPEIELPAWLDRPAPRERVAQPPLSPSRLLAGEAASPLAGAVLADGTARRRGVALHRLFELLPDVPPERRRDTGLALLKRWGLADAAPDLIETVLAIFAHPQAAPLFGPGSRAEVAIAGEMDLAGRGPVAVNGQIDRLAILPDSVLIADFKTGRPPRDPAAVPEAILAQLAAYRALLVKLEPGRPVRCLVIWTAVPEIVEISCEALERALHLVGSVRENTAIGDRKP